MQKRIITCLTALLLFSPFALAESLYVTDRILLGVHTQASRDSMLVESVPSGTSLKILEEKGGFKKVKLPNGTEGWVDAAFLVSEQPAPARYDILLNTHQVTLKEIEALKDQLNKTERELQVRRDELSNAKTSIQELKKKSRNPGSANENQSAELETANAEIEKLKAQIAELEATQNTAAPTPAAPAPPSAQVEEELATLRTRIELAMQNLKGEDTLTLDEVAKIRPGIPGWFWGTLVLFLVVGATAGILFMDYRNRKRHGGFRV